MRIKKPYRKSRRWYKVIRARAHRQRMRRRIMPTITFWSPEASPLISLLR